MKEEEERQKSAKQSTDTSDRIPINVPDPEEDDLDDLDGMTGTLPRPCGALYLFSQICSINSQIPTSANPKMSKKKSSPYKGEVFMTLVIWTQLRMNSANNFKTKWLRSWAI